jgi:serine/threonine protein kinase
VPASTPTDITAIIHAATQGDFIVDSLWLRAHPTHMAQLPCSGWKLHLSATPLSLVEMLTRALPHIQQSGCPWKCIASPDLLEELNDGRYGLTQVGKAVTIYPHTESVAADLASVLTQELNGLPGPIITTDSRHSPNAPVYFRFGPYDVRTTIDSLGRKQRLLQLPNGNDACDTPHAPYLPQPTALPTVPPHDHLDFLRADYLPVHLLNVTARGAVLIALPIVAKPPHPVLIKTAQRHALADEHGRDALWALQREHEILQALAPFQVAPPPGDFTVSPCGNTAAIIRPYVNVSNLAEHWQSPAAALAVARNEQASRIAHLALAIERVHIAGHLVRDISPSNLLLEGDGFLLADLELAYTSAESEQPYRRGTTGFYDSTLPRYATPDWRADAFALLSLAHMLHTGVHPQWTRTTGFANVPPVPVSPAFAQAWESTAASPTAADFQVQFQILARSVGERPASPTTWDWSAPGALQQLHQHAAAKSPSSDPDHANIFSGHSGLLLALSEFGMPLSSFDPTPLLAAAHQVRHIPGAWFGASGIALALLPTAPEEATQLLLDTAWESSQVPDLCHGLAGYLLALLDAHAATGNSDFLTRAHGVANALCALAKEDEAGCHWLWPEGVSASLSQSPQFGLAHGTAGVVLALARYSKTYPSRDLDACLAGGVASLRAGAQPVSDDAPEALWWPVSAQDESCWNAWSHGTPGVLKALCAAYTANPALVPLELLHAALGGIRAANNAGYCLCHGIASRLDAYVDAVTTLGPAAPAWLADAALTDATALAALDVFALEARTRPEAGDDGYGLMKGAAGVVRTLLKFDSALRAGLFFLPAGFSLSGAGLGPGGHPALPGQILAAQGFERGTLGGRSLHRGLLL